ncbi:Panacea domain-containing protein [Kribbella steppae]|nr:type II toxin-antitoxin system antitoxin SocA domain-containing protein [Kribbella steppae]
MKLEKLVYYSKAWHLVWEERSLFSERIEAWANGPVVRDLYRNHRGLFTVSEWPSGDPKQLDKGERESIDAVLDYYAPMTAHQLSELTHREGPWIAARERAHARPGEWSSAEILEADMHEYYDGLTSASTD